MDSDKAVAADQVERALSGAGFTKTGLTGWRREIDQKVVLLFVSYYIAGDTVPGWTGQPALNQVAVQLLLSIST